MMDPEHIMQVGMGFLASKTLLSAVELGVFTELACGPRPPTSSASGSAYTRGVVATSSTRSSRSACSSETATGRRRATEHSRERAFLDRTSPAYVGGILEMANARLYPLLG